jgi:hypothetical protein
VTATQMIELAVAAAMVVGGIWLQVRGRREDAEHGSQGAMILLVIGLIVAIHGLGLHLYRPSQGEIDRAAEQGDEQ